MTKKIDLCSVSYNTKHLLIRQLQHLSKGDYEDFNLYIADNASTDGSVEYLKDFKPPDFVKEIVYNTNIGYAGACNRLGSAGDGEIVGLLNADVWLTADDVKKIAESFDNHPEMDIMGPKQRDENGRIRHAGIEGSNTAPKHRGWAVHDSDDSLFRDYKEMVTVSGSAYFIRRSVWDALTNDSEYKEIIPNAIGPLLPTPHYWEETWVSYFARHKGYKVYYDGSISIGHSWHASHPIGSEKDTKAFGTSKKMFAQACKRFGIEHD